MATEEPIVAVESAPDPVPDPVPAELATGEQKEVKEPKTKKASKPRNPPLHPPYIEMVTDAIVTLKDKNGSSQYAITKFIEEKQKQLPPNFKKLLLFQLKKLVASGKIVKFKASFKLPSTPSSSAPAKRKPAAKLKTVGGTKGKKVPAKAKAAAPKSKTAAKTKTVPKAKPVTKAKVAAKPKTVAKSKPKPKAKDKPAKAARTSTRTSPGKKTPASKPALKRAPAKKVPAKNVKPKTVKSPAKKAAAKKGKK